MSVNFTDEFFEPAKPVEIEEKIERSRFIARLAICRDEAEIRLFLGQVEASHKNATHNCWAYRLGPDPETEHSSDDGEPSGTAGRPILSSIKKRDLYNVAIVVTRYFGGIKLGVRGLIDAYGMVSGLAVEASGVLKKTCTKHLEISLPYAIIGRVKNLLDSHRAGDNLIWNYDPCGSGVRVRAEVPLSETDALVCVLNELQAMNIVDFWSWL